VANELVARARKHKVVIVFGDMTGLRFDNDKRRCVTDKTHKMPYAKMANILTYKAHLGGQEWECIPEKESDTSVTCWRCVGRRTHHGKHRGVSSVTTVDWTTTARRMARRTSRVRSRRWGWGLLWLSPKRRSYSKDPPVR
jgi:hypothetical protein